MQQIPDKILHILIIRLIQKEPVKRSIFIPLMILGKVLTHKEQLLTGMTKHKEIAALQVTELILALSRHLIDHRALKMNHFIM